MPVTTPIAKLISISLPKNLVSRSHDGFFVRSQAVSIPATSAVRPIVSGTKRKW